jgi:hypothetical protein
MRTTISFIIASLAPCSTLLYAAPSFASDATFPPGERVLAMATIVAITLLLLGLGLYCEVALLRPLVRRTAVDAQAREEREENARQEVAKASADLYAALTDLQEQIQLVHVAPSPAAVAAALAEHKVRSRAAPFLPTAATPAHAALPTADLIPAGEPVSDPPRDTQTMLPPAMTLPPPSDAAGAAGVGDDDPTHVLSREALHQALAGVGDSQAPRAPTSRSVPPPDRGDVARRPQVFQRRSSQ